VFQSVQTVHAWTTHLVKGGNMKGVNVSWHQRKAVMGAQLLLLPDKKQIEKKKALAARSDGSLSPRSPRDVEVGAITIKNCALERQAPNTVTTNKDGIAVLSHNTNRTSLLVAKKGKDCAFLLDVWTFPTLPAEENLLWHVFDDRRYHHLPPPAASHVARS
jgi:hypothetical protein